MSTCRWGVCCPPPAQVEEPSPLDEVERLTQLKDEGVITEEEFEAKKKQLLDL